MFKQLRTRAIITIVVLLMLSLSAVGAVSANLFAPIRPVTELSVVDGRGRLVGAVKDLSTGTLVVIRVGTTPVVLTVQRNWLGPSISTSPVDSWFESSDCTGPVFSMEMGAPDNLFSSVSLNGTRLYLQSGSAQTVTVRSFLGFSDTPGPCATVEPAEMVLVPMELLADLAAEFTPPFRLRFGDGN